MPTMKDLPEIKRTYQAEVHFALGAVIQGITVAALGGQLAAALRELPFPGAIWVFMTALQSMLLVIAFWYTFMNNYFFGFRVINLTAGAHLVYAVLYLVLGLLQLTAIHFLESPRLWLTFYLLLIATTMAGSWITQHVTVIRRKQIEEALNYDPGARLFLITVLLVLLIVIIWYAVPGIDSDWFRLLALSASGAGLILFIHHRVQIFQKHLDVAL
jgi:hypothetical protein